MGGATLFHDQDGDFPGYLLCPFECSNTLGACSYNWPANADNTAHLSFVFKYPLANDKKQNCGR